MCSHIEVSPEIGNASYAIDPVLADVVLIDWIGDDTCLMPEWAYHQAEGGYIVENGVTRLFDIELRM